MLVDQGMLDGLGEEETKLKVTVSCFCAVLSDQKRTVNMPVLMALHSTLEHIPSRSANWSSYIKCVSKRCSWALTSTTPTTSSCEFETCNF
jgi:hypothetical protein